ncbi:hypothetical protein [Bacillus cereus group sp. BfR-BA-01310]|uniref:DUF7695 domain-containing protein n=1 Tax=Bacillus cereus group sp. BfR-BA-01310 TaxID=2920287 RepID=UPI001F57BFDE|nr:hypothetical protein [Bacillus cereus group sp. BfR-BA-01310]
MAKKLKRNTIQCRKCGDVIFKYYLCRSIAVDSGLEYGRMIGNSEDIIELHGFEEEKEDWMLCFARDGKI